MKKNLFFFAAAALALASCSSDETVLENASLMDGDEIEFRTLTNGVTRAETDPGVMTAFTASNAINVWADYDKAGDDNQVKLFYDKYTASGSPITTWTPANGKHYWPSDVSATKEVTFYATYGGVTQTAGGVFAGYTPQSEVASQVDLLVGKTIRTTGSAGGAVVINLRHALSQIALKVKNTNANLKITVSEARIGCISTAATAFSLAFDNSATNSDTKQAVTSGSLTSGADLISASSWTVTTSSITANGNKYDQNPTDVVFEGTKNGSTVDAVLEFGSPWLLLPQTMKAFSTTTYTGSGKEYVTKQNGSATGTPDLSGSYIALKLTIDNWNGEAATGNIVTDQWCYWPIDDLGAWTPGLKYTYTINMAGGGYYPQDMNSDGKLDQILQEIVISPSCTIDVWNEQSESAVAN